MASTYQSKMRVRWKKAIFDLRRYCQETTIHGIRYLVDVDSWMEKFWWFLIVITGFALASFLIYRAVVEWEDHPILTTVDSSSVPITSIQFPTITICPKRRVVYRQMQSSLLYNPWNMIENLFNQFNLTNFNDDPEEIRFMNDTSFLLDVVISSIQRTLTQNIKFDFEQLKIKWADELDSDYYREVVG